MDGYLDSLRLAIEPVLRIGGDVNGLGVVDRLQVAPSECANGRGAVVGDEAHGGVAGRVVKVDDGADVVAVECSNPSVWKEVAACVSASFERCEVVGWIGESARGCPGFSYGCAVQPIPEDVEWLLGKRCYESGRRVDCGGEGLCFRAPDRAQEIVFRVLGLVEER